MTNKLLRCAGLAVLFGAAFGCGNLKSHDDDMPLRVHYLPDGTLLVVARNTIELFAGDLSAQKSSFPVPPTDSTINLGSDNFSLSEDGTTAAISVADQQGSRIELYDIPSGTRRSSFPIPPSTSPYADYPHAIALSPAGDLVFVMGPDGALMTSIMFDTGSGQALWSTDVMGYGPTFSPDGSVLYRMDGYPGTNLLGVDARSGAVSLNAAPAMPPPLEFAAMPDAHTLIAVAGVDQACIAANAAGMLSICPGWIELVSADDGSVINRASFGPGEELPGTVIFGCSVAAGLCAVEVTEPLGPGGVLTDGGQGDAVQADAGPADAGQADAGPVDATSEVAQTVLQIWSVQGTVKLVQTVPTGTAPGFQAARSVAISPDGQFLASAQGNGDVAVYRISDGSLVHNHPFGGSIF